RCRAGREPLLGAAERGGGDAGRRTESGEQLVGVGLQLLPGRAGEAFGLRVGESLGAGDLGAQLRGLDLGESASRLGKGLFRLASLLAFGPECLSPLSPSVSSAACSPAVW